MGRSWKLMENHSQELNCKPQEPKKIRSNKMVNNGCIVVQTTNEVAEFVYLSKRLDLVLVAFSDHVIKELDNFGVSYLRAPSGYINFKKYFLGLNPGVVIYSTDTFSPGMQWLGCSFTSFCIYNKPIDLDYEYYQKIHNYLNNCGGIVGWLNRIFGQHLTVYGNKVSCLPCSIKESLRFLFFQLFYGYRFKFVDMPGWFADYVILPAEAVKNIYLDHGFRDECLKVIGSPVEDFYLYLHDKLRQQITEKTIDILLFSQPYYKYGENSWLEEVQLLAKDCTDNGLNLHIAHHPRDDESAYADIEGIRIIKGPRTNEENMKLTISAKLVVVKTTTLRLLPIVSGIPVLYLNYCDFSRAADVKARIDRKLHLNKIGDLAHIVEYVSSSSEWCVKQHQELSRVGSFDNQSINRLSTLIFRCSGMHQ